MNLSRKWLNEFVTIEANDKEFAEAMTLSGSKVEITTDLGAEITNVVVGKVLSLVRHENSDHMWVCQIDVGDGIGAAAFGVTSQYLGYGFTFIAAAAVTFLSMVFMAKDKNTAPRY